MLARSPGAQKKRRQRERARNGLTVLGVGVHEHNLIEALIKAELLTEAQALDRGELARAGSQAASE